MDSPVMDEDLKVRIEQVRERIHRACIQSCRKPDSVVLIAVTKTQPVELLQALLDHGISNLGENRVQEILGKAPLLHGEYTMHLIGHLQTNKVARVLPYVQMIQSVDTVRLVEFIEKYLPGHARIPVLVEINTSGERSKNGCAPENSREIIERIVSSARVIPAGYMTIGPFGSGEKGARASFALLRETAERNRDLIPEYHLSMGMSGDFEWAIQEGATMVRIGSLLCGERGR